MRCPACGRTLNKAEQLWTSTHGGRQCSHCWAGVQFLGPDAARRPASAPKRTPRRARGDRRLAA